MKTAFLQCIRFQGAILLAGFQPLNPFSDRPLATFQKQKRVDSQPNLSFSDAE
jgi:hypothetical protein